MTAPFPFRPARAAGLALMASVGVLGGCFPWARDPLGTGAYKYPTSSPKRATAHADGDVAALAGLPSLKRVRLPVDTREMRVWVASTDGSAAPDFMLRLVATPDDVQGEVIAWWAAPGGEALDLKADRSEDVLRENLALRATMRDVWGCRRIERGGGFEACRLRFKKEPKWRDVLTVLDTLGAWGIPDQEELRALERPAAEEVEAPAPDATDMTITVEARVGAAYRTYSFLNPDEQKWAEARRVAALADLVAGIARRARADAPSRD